MLVVVVFMLMLVLLIDEVVWCDGVVVCEWLGICLNVLLFGLFGFQMLIKRMVLVVCCLVEEGMDDVYLFVVGEVFFVVDFVGLVCDLGVEVRVYEVGFFLEEEFQVLIEVCDLSINFCYLIVGEILVLLLCIFVWGCVVVVLDYVQFVDFSEDVVVCILVVFV